MGNLNCLNTDENIENILKRNDEISPDDSFIIKNKYSKKIYFENNINKDSKLDRSADNINNHQSNQEINKLSESKHYKIYSVKSLSRTQIKKIKELIDYFHLNGKPHPSDDFYSKNWQNFYPKNDPFFIIKDFEVIHDQIKIYNPRNINKIKIYQGDLNKQGQRHGIGKYTTPFYVLIGMWKKDKFSGWGRESRCNGDVFEGRFINGIINGKGIFLDIKNNKYIGDFINMKRWGRGKWYTNKIRYEGEFYNNKIHGKGQITFLKSGIQYKGTFKSDQIDGYGTFKWLNGDIYEGEVKNGKMHGMGKYKYNNGKIFTGIFINGKIAERKEAIKTLKEKNEEKLKNKLNNDTKSPHLQKTINKYTFDKRRTYINNYNNNLFNNINKKSNIAIYKPIQKVNLDIEKKIEKKTNDLFYDLPKSNSFKIMNGYSKDLININKNEINNFADINNYGPIQEVSENINNNNEDSKKFAEFNIKQNNLTYNNNNLNFDLDNEIKYNEFEITNYNDKNKNNNYGIENELDYDKIFKPIENNVEYINEINKYLDEHEASLKISLENYNEGKGSLIRELLQMQQNEENMKTSEIVVPNKGKNALLSTYRNFGFGDAPY